MLLTYILLKFDLLLKPATCKSSKCLLKLILLKLASFRKVLL
jgi:hypothetical protein